MLQDLPQSVLAVVLDGLNERHRLFVLMSRRSFGACLELHVTERRKAAVAAFEELKALVPAIVGASLAPKGTIVSLEETLSAPGAKNRQVHALSLMEECGLIRVWTTATMIVAAGKYTLEPHITLLSPGANAVVTFEDGGDDERMDDKDAVEIVKRTFARIVAALRLKLSLYDAH